MACSAAWKSARYECFPDRHGAQRTRRAHRASGGPAAAPSFVAQRPAWPLGVLLLAATLALATQLNGYYVFVLANVALLAIVGVGMNVLLGLTGQVSFGHVGFYAIGAYTVAILTGSAGWNFWLAWPVAMLLAGAAGWLLALPALRVKGPYLAMITIAFGFIVEHGAIEWRGLTGGQNGLMGIAQPSLFGVGGERGVTMIALITAAVALTAFALLSRGTWGAAMRAVKDSETAAESIGIDPVRVKTVAFALSAALAGLAGGLFAPLSGMVTPNSFAFIQSILFVLVVMIGGAGAVLGPVFGAVIVGLLPELLSSLEEFRLLFFGALLLVVLWVAPGGVSGLFAHWRSRAVPALPNAAGAALGTALPLPVRVRQALGASGLTRVFGGVRAVSGLDLQVPAGAVTALIGPNGAGKTTALNMLSGFYTPSSGSFALGAAPLQGGVAWRAARRGVARTYQTSQLFGTLSVEDNVALAASQGRLGALLGAQRFSAPAVRERSRELLVACGYHGAPNALAADLPHVDRRVVEIARALATDPDVLLLDEPAAGLSREDKAQLAALLRRIAQAGIGVLLVEHDMALVMDISDQVVVLDAGQRLAAGSPAAIQQDPAVRKAYLGDGELFQGTRQPASAAAANEDVSPPEVLHVTGLVTGYGAEPVLRGIDLHVRRGEMVALLGANGAGKSTLMRALAGLHRPLRGAITLDGEDITTLGAEQIVARGLVLVPEGRQVFPELSVRDNIRLGGFLKPEGLDARLEDMLERFPRLRERLHQRAGLLSGGEQQMLAIARGLMAQPQVLLLDEPSLGLAPKVIDELFTALDRLRNESMTVLLVDQMAGLALALADHACVIENGEVVASGSASEIAASPALHKAYLGD